MKLSRKLILILNLLIAFTIYGIHLKQIFSSSSRRCHSIENQQESDKEENSIYDFCLHIHLIASGFLFNNLRLFYRVSFVIKEIWACLFKAYRLRPLLFGNSWACESIFSILACCNAFDSRSHCGILIRI